MTVRKSNDGELYTAYYNIKTIGNKVAMVYFSGRTFAEAINKALEYIFK